MKILPPFAALSAFFTVTAALCAAPVDSHLTAATVYLDRAVVTRTATAELSVGVQEVTFSSLPVSLVDQSLQVSGRGTATATILDVTARNAFVEVTPDARVKTLEDELNALLKQRRSLDDRTKLLELQLKTVEHMEVALISPPTKDAPRPALADLTSTLNFISEQRAKNTADQAALDEARDVLAPKIAAAEARLNEIRGAAKGRSTKSVTVRVNATTAGRLDLTLSYTVHGASWTPAYDARVNTTDRAVELGYFGVVRQNTGEDWRDVALTLSTARPSLGGGPAPLTPWTLDIFTPRPVVAYENRRELSFKSAIAPQSSDIANLQTWSGGSLAGAPQRERDAESAQASVETAATSATFRIAAPSTVASDNAPQKVAITTARLAATPEYLAIPKRLPAAFLTTKVSNTSDYPFLAGAMNVFLDGTFVAASQLRAVQPGEKFDLSLGVDEGIALKRKLVNRFAEDTGFTNGGRRVTYEFLLSVQNNKKTAERVVLLDQLPISRNEKIVVKHLSPDPKDLKPDNEGVLKWTLDLKPGEKREITLKFSVDHPADVNVTGLQ
jgi:uncharacterized protein (TIGR02231 family)